MLSRNSEYGGRVSFSRRSARSTRSERSIPRRTPSSSVACPVGLALVSSESRARSCHLIRASPRLTPAAFGEKVFAEESAPEHQPRDREFHVGHLRLDLAIDVAAKAVAGTSTLTLSP